MKIGDIRVGAIYSGRDPRRDLGEAATSTRVVLDIKESPMGSRMVTYRPHHGVVNRQKKTVSLYYFAEWVLKEVFDHSGPVDKAIDNLVADGSLEESEKDNPWRYYNAPHEGELEEWEVKAKKEREKKMSEAVKFTGSTGKWTEIMGVGSSTRGDTITWVHVRLGEAFRDDTGDLWLAVGTVAMNPQLAARLLNLRTLKDESFDDVIEKMHLIRVNLVINVTQG